MDARKNVGAVVAAVLIGLGFAPGAAHAEEPVTAQADLDGDGTAETITVTAKGDSEQVLTTWLGGAELTSSAPMDSYAGVQPLRVVDVNADGREEVVVTEQVGANTVTLSVHGLGEDTFSPVITPDNEVLKLYEGGGVSTRSAFTCLADHDTQELVVLGAELDEPTGGEPTYSGTRTSYLVAHGLATPTAIVPFSGVTATDPAIEADPALCT